MDLKYILHFVRNNITLSHIYVGAYESSIYDTSASTYLKEDEQVADFTTDKLSSIVGAKPCSGLTQNLTIKNCRKLANNNGLNYGQIDFTSSSAIQMLFLIEYASFDSQSMIGQGVVNKVDGTGNESEKTGETSSLGNSSGMANGTNGLVSVSYRGIENFWGNIWCFIEGLNIEAKNKNIAYWSNVEYSVNTGINYNRINFTISKANGYISKLGYDENNDFVFLPSESRGSSTKPIGDYIYQSHTHNGWLIALLCAEWNNGTQAGYFYWNVNNTASNRNRNISTHQFCKLK